MSRIAKPLVALLLTATPVWADGLCQLPQPFDAADLAGTWARDGAVSVVNETQDILRPSAQYTVTITPDGALQSPFVDSLTGTTLPLMLLGVPAYDVDRIDDVLDTTERADIADTLSDTRCGPEALPQVQGSLNITGEVSVTGTITLIAYFDDRVLQVTELELQSSDAILFMTETALLRPDHTQ